MPVSLTHFAESILSAIINSDPAAFGLLAGIGASSIAQGGAFGGPAFVEARLAPYGGRPFDGAARVDVILALCDGSAVPFELKLGTTRLTKSRIDMDWLAECKPSHTDSRWSGNMMAVLERKFLGVNGPRELIATVDPPNAPASRHFVLTRRWFVVARRSVVARWTQARPAFSPNVRLLAFEDIIAALGGKDVFNALVKAHLDIDFYDAWLGVGDDTE